MLYTVLSLPSHSVLHAFHGCPFPRTKSFRGVLYRPPPCICAVICALFSWNRSLRRCWENICFWTQRVMQPLSREDRDFEVKSSMQEAKQWSTTLPKIYKIWMSA